MNNFEVRQSTSCSFDLLALGEVMLRLDPGEGRIRTARQFRVFEGGGEYNVARGLRRCFNQRSAIVTGVVDNEIGRLLEDLMLQGGVDLSMVQWRTGDGIGRNLRNGLNFTERGFGIRGALGVSDRGHSAASALRPGEIDWHHIFGTRGVRWLHTGGIFAALSPTSFEVALEALTIAKQYGVMVSYDLNYRPSLWQASGDSRRSQELNRQLVSKVDLLIGNEEDFSAALGFAVAGMDSNLRSLNINAYKEMMAQVAASFPNLRMVATTLREVTTATLNGWQALALSAGHCYQSLHFPALEIMDRIGGGDSFASGLIYGLLQGFDPQTALNYGVAHGALAMTTPGDTSMATLREVEKLLTHGGARVER